MAAVVEVAVVAAGEATEVDVAPVDLEPPAAVELPAAAAAVPEPAVVAPPPPAPHALSATAANRARATIEMRIQECSAPGGQHPAPDPERIPRADGRDLPA